MREFLNVRKFSYPFLCFVFAAIFTFLLLLIPCTTVSAQTQTFGRFRVTVKDGLSDLPIANATVCIPEIDGYFTTDEHGYTDVIEVPIASNLSFANTLARTWGEVTVLAYKDGYIDCLLLYTAVRENLTRLGPVIFLFPKGNADSSEYHLQMEKPNSGWISKFISKYRR